MDEGDTPEGLARNRRVEVSKFFASRAGTLDDLRAAGTDVRLDEIELRTNDNLELGVVGDLATLSLAPQTAHAGGVRITSPDPSVEVGFLQIITDDARLAGYSLADADGNVADAAAPPAAFLDYGHCLEAFTPCRDVELARQPFSAVGRGPNLEQRTAKQSSSPADLFWDTRQQIELPASIALPAGGSAVLTQVAWKMRLQTLLVARSGELIVPGGGLAWELAVFARFAFGVAPKNRGRSEQTSISIASRPIETKGPFPDLDKAMSLPTAGLRESMMNTVCRPTVLQAGVNQEFEDEMRRVQEILREARRRALPDEA
jgi:hypothetical protein